MKSVAILICLMSFHILVDAQDIKQTIRGKVIDNETKMPLMASTVAVYRDSILVGGSTSNSEVYFRIENIPVGRYTVVSSFIGYRQEVVSDVIVNSASEVILTFELEDGGGKYPQSEPFRCYGHNGGTGLYPEQ